MRKTKIICTMGPSTDKGDVMEQLVREGMDVARFNFSHGPHDEQRGRIQKLRELRKKYDRPVAALLDTKGPEIRLGCFKDGKVSLEEGQIFTFTNKDIEGTNECVSITYKELYKDVQPGGHILVDDGLVDLEVQDIAGKDIVCKVINAGVIGDRKGVNVPGANLKMPFISKKDHDDLLFGIQEGFDFVAASFTRTANDIREVRKILKENGGEEIQIIAKIENSEGIDNIDEIIRCADGIMVARGDLGVEIPAEEVPYLQKLIIQKCNDNYKPVITATQMLDSMIRNPRPTRAEVGDVANAVYDGTDAVMLSGETAQGKYPVEALKMMVHIVESTEQHLDYKEMLEKAGAHRMRNASSALAYATVTTARNLKAACIITPTVSGATARVVSKFKPKTEIIGISPNEETLRRMQIYWGVRPYCSINANSTDEICSSALDLVRAKQIAETGDTVVLTAGIPSPNISGNVAGVSNIMKIAVID